MRGLPKGSPGTVHVPSGLEFDPQRGIGSEEDSKPDRGIGRDRSPAADQLVDPSAGDTHRARKGVLGNTCGLHEAGFKKMPRGNRSPRASHQNRGAAVRRSARGNRFRARTPRFGGSGGDTGTCDRLHRWNPGHVEPTGCRPAYPQPNMPSSLTTVVPPATRLKTAYFQYDGIAGAERADNPAATFPGEPKGRFPQALAT